MTVVIKHHGVKGQKWGVTRVRTSVASGVRKTAKGAYDNRGKIFVAATLAATGGLTLTALNSSVFDSQTTVKGLSIDQGQDPDFKPYFKTG